MQNVLEFKHAAAPQQPRVATDIPWIDVKIPDQKPLGMYPAIEELTTQCARLDINMSVTMGIAQSPLVTSRTAFKYFRYPTYFLITGRRSA